ncbi:MAG: C2H2-type zinc finger protein [Candidatus Endonucleobacter bathymodioli]|uniref:C2H2-type zinc finger protein n=1 Tax=Candidatus Endonucleibacter bathymodioli TaxID=539814 RepID=A0AA90SMF7_9GAMM|nr:C2H2-type zinc finger protein [Candidatus Endonucleobacter bathymodioli]
MLLSCLLLASWYTKSASEQSIDAGVLLEVIRALEKSGKWVFKEVSPELVPECRSNERILLIIDSVFFVDKHSLVDGVLHFDDCNDLGLDLDLGLSTGIETGIDTRVEDYLVLCLISMLESNLQKETFVNNPNHISAKYSKLSEKISSCGCALLEVNTDNIFVDIASGKGFFNYAAVGSFTCNSDYKIECNIQNITYNIESNKEELQTQKAIEIDAKSDCVSGTSITKKSRVKSRQHCKCDVCGDILSGASSLKKHMNIHNPNPEYRCSLCFKYYNSKSSLIKHRKIRHFICYEHVCETCHERFAEYNALKKHRTIHVREQVLRCDCCNDLFSTQYNLTTHYEVCKKKYRSDNRKHAAVGKIPSNDDEIEYNITNIICNDRESKPESQIQENGWFDAKGNYVLGASINKKCKIKADKKCKCDVCGRIICNSLALKVHMRTHNLSDAYKCSLCCKYYASSTGLKKHFAAKHAIYIDHVCSKCQERFTVYKDYRKHRMMHGRNDIHKCDYCKVSFSTKSNLDIHINTCKKNTRQW